MGLYLISIPWREEFRAVFTLKGHVEWNTDFLGEESPRFDSGAGGRALPPPLPPQQLGPALQCSDIRNKVV